MSYKSPIEILMKEAKLDFENGIYNAIQEYEINVDKDELIKALNYDREMYKKGYNDAIHDLMDKLNDMKLEG